MSAGDMTLSEKIKYVRAQVQKGEGEAVLKECAANEEPVQSLLIAEVKLRMDEPEDAKAAATKALGLFKTKGDMPGQIRAMQVLADARMWYNECGEAIRVCTEAVRLCWKAGDKESEAAIMHTSAGAFLLQSKYAEAGRAATRAAILYRALGDNVGEAMALETAATASVSSSPQEAGKGATESSMLLKELRGPVGGQGMMDAIRMGQPAMFDKRLWQPVSKFHPIMQQRENLVHKAQDLPPPSTVKGNDGKPLFVPKRFGWGRSSHRLDQGWYQQVLVAGDKIL